MYSGKMVHGPAVIQPREDAKQHGRSLLLFHGRILREIRAARSSKWANCAWIPNFQAQACSLEYFLILDLEVMKNMEGLAST